MSSRLSRSIVSLILAPYVAVSGALPRDHVHEADLDHHHAAVHRHLRVHDQARPDHDHTRLAEDDAHVVWLEGAAVGQAAYQLPGPALAASVTVQLGSPATVWTAGFDYSAAPAHGPPRTPASLRAPPTPLPAVI